VELCSERQFSDHVVGPIPCTRIEEYAERRGLDPEMVAVFSEVIREIDEQYLRDQRDAEKARQDRERRDAEERAKQA